MSPKAPTTVVSALALDTGAAPAAAMPKMVGAPMGQAGSKEALARLTAAMSELKAISVKPLLDRAVQALKAERHQEGAEWALKALDKDETNGFGWYLLAIARERVGDFTSAITAYETALRLLPDHSEVANDLGRLAYRIDMKPQAEKLFRHFLARFPGHHEGSNNLACVLRDRLAYDEAIELLRPAIVANPTVAMLWNTMGTVMAEQGDYENGEIFFREAVRLDANFAKARYNLANARLSQGDAEEALVLCEQALTHPMSEDERQMMELSRSTMLVVLGRIGEGWDVYEARLHPSHPDVTHFMVDVAGWTPGADLAGKSLLVIGEQGLGDEILFGQLLPDVIEALGPEGRLTLAVEPRLVSLFQRSFPEATVGAHATYLKGGRTYRTLPFVTDFSDYDLWTPLASLLREFRRTTSAFPDRVGFLTPDPARVAHWRAELEKAPAGVKVGLLWKSNIKTGARYRFYSPFADWAPVLKAKGVTLINLQYGDCSEEIAQAERDFGVSIWTPPGIDLKQDLDDVAALCRAVDLVVGFSNATMNLAAGVGAPTWLISVPGAWTRLGTSRYPWYPQVRTFTTPAFGNWTPVMEAVGDALEAFVAER
ncbi:MAG: tetratricopeptide repeat protein [Alphaproteobacteria bacterium]|nr:tetratricopeptide repeat protein [Alphaproteobacteria bacterium]MBU1513914.1 tetratricopeptide repeat protein [Alphaproteobacteria bacterium]MBU2094180.1 tetratricopeptide repeat protein [Alphaproteobacteria bacterium]MBU2150478.1 tetratricopeptide repeat protein [Alphaproteobacteria bacterium]MBU2307670.1 tetratricopeptide repeat protein [Alphaproteobacteria bacterium]